MVAQGETAGLRGSHGVAPTLSASKELLLSPVHRRHRPPLSAPQQDASHSGHPDRAFLYLFRDVTSAHLVLRQMPAGRSRVVPADGQSGGEGDSPGHGGRGAPMPSLLHQQEGHSAAQEPSVQRRPGREPGQRVRVCGAPLQARQTRTACPKRRQEDGSTRGGQCQVDGCLPVPVCILAPDCTAGAQHPQGQRATRPPGVLGR